MVPSNIPGKIPRSRAIMKHTHIPVDIAQEVLITVGFGPDKIFKLRVNQKLRQILIIFSDIVEFGYLCFI
jgi:hypothetical protein